MPRVAAAPLVRVAPDRLVWSVHGLTTEPLLFLTRELRRRAAPEYHNAAYLREITFRQELYALFRDKRFVTSANRIELRRSAGDVRTDIDAVVYLSECDPSAIEPGDLVRARVTAVKGYDVVASVEGTSSRSPAERRQSSPSVPGFSGSRPGLRSGSLE